MNKIHWHPAFCGATEWELRGNKQNLSFETEHTLSKEPLRMDLLIIRKDPAAVIQVSVYENRELYWEVSRRNQDMCCEALRELMKDDLIEASTKSKTEANLECIRNLMKNMKLSAKQAMEALGIPKADRKKYAAML